MRVRILSVKQPYSWLLVSGQKDIENRDWYTKYRGIALIHASANQDRHPNIRVSGIKVPKELPRGGIVGAILITDCVANHSSPWFVGHYGFVVSAAISLPFTQQRGALGLRWAPDELTQQFEKLPEWCSLARAAEEATQLTLP